MDDFFADIADFVERLKLHDLILIGHSMGGRNALFYSACFAEKVDRLILVDARAGNSPASAIALRAATEPVAVSIGLDERDRSTYARPLSLFIRGHLPPFGSIWLQEN